jgi:hypothetical protein
MGSEKLVAAPPKLQQRIRAAQPVEVPYPPSPVDQF